MGWRFWRRSAAEPHDGSHTRRGGGSRQDHGERSDPTAALRVRARRRLIGAAALLLAAAVVLPMVLDEAPRPVTDEIPIDIPSDKTPFAPRLALPPALETGSAPGAPLPDSAPAQPVEGKPAPKSDQTETSAKQDGKAQAKPSVKPSPAQADGAADELRARSILEGKTGDATAAASGSAKYLLQAAAFGSEAAARELAARLEKAGFTTFTERADTKDGVRYRVRLGPYATRDEAERVRARLRAIGIRASIVTA